MEKVGRPIVWHLSDLARESLKAPGSWRCLEVVYRNEPRKPLDYYFLRSRSARGARSRLRVLKAEISRAIREFAETRYPVRIISLGSGAGHEVVESLAAVPPDLHVEGTCVDKEADALRYSEGLAAKAGLNGRVSYVRANVLRLPFEGGYHIGVVSGLLDYFGTHVALAALTKLNTLLVPGGIAFVANMRRHPLASTMRILGDWRLVYREPEQLGGLLVRSGFETVEVRLEPEGVFCIAKGRKPIGASCRPGT